MGGKASTPAAQPQEPPAPFALPCLPNEFIAGNSLFLTEDYVPYPAILEHKCIVVRIANVTDGDTFRGRHIPDGHKLYPYPIVKKHQRIELFAHSKPWTGKLKGETLRLRIYAVDAPESAKMGRPGQPFAEEATQFMKQKVLNRIVFVRLLAKDQYGRLIVQVLVPCSALGTQASLKSAVSLKSLKSQRKFSWSFLSCCTGCKNNRELTRKERGELCEDVSQSLLMAGLATIYKGSNAQYNGKLERLEALLEEAQERKMGMFSTDQPLESPGSFKRRLREGYLDVPEAEDAGPEEEPPPPTRGRSPARGNKNRRGGSASPKKRTNLKASDDENAEKDNEANGEEGRKGRAKGRQRRKKKSRSGSARRKRAAERAAATEATAETAETGKASRSGVLSSFSAPAKSVTVAETSSQQASTGNPKGLRVRGINEDDGLGFIHTNTLTFCVDEAPAMTGYRRNPRGVDQAANASMSGRLSYSSSQQQSGTSRLLLQAETKPLAELGEAESSESEADSESGYGSEEER